MEIQPSVEQDRYHTILLSLVAGAVLLNFSGLFVTILGPDGALYASISKSIVVRNNYAELIAEGRDWLDKPHFPFWVTALSFEVFGFTTWAYKLPAILFLIGGAFYTYRLTLLLYGKNIALWSTIIFLTAEHIILSNNDVRAEPYLTGLVMAAVFHFYVNAVSGKWIHLVLGSLFMALAIMTKGIFAIVPIGAGLIIHLLLKRKREVVFSWRWLVAFLLTAVFIIPEIYCLWLQFDQHPEKKVFGTTGVSGVRFFFWDSQFGRFFNTGPIKGKGDPFFFVHTLLWAFLPWSLLFYAAVAKVIFKNWKNPFWHTEWISFGSAVVTLLMFSLSRFQLPHYANIVFPFLAMMVSAYVHDTKSGRAWKVIGLVQTAVVILMLVAPFLIHFVYRPERISLPVIAWLLVLLALFFLIGKMAVLTREQLILIRTVLAAFFLNFYLNTTFYPSLLKYQSGSEAAFYANQHSPALPVVQIRKDYSYPLEFYVNSRLITIDSVSDLANLQKPLLLYGKFDSVLSKKFPIIQTFEDFPVSRMDGRFFNYQSRQKKLERYCLYEIRD